MGTVGVEVSARVAVSVGKGVLLGIGVAAASVFWADRVNASSVAEAAASASSTISVGDWDGRLQADTLRIKISPTIENFLLVFIAHSRINISLN
jgi:hypothetical protein